MNIGEKKERNFKKVQRALLAFALAPSLPCPPSHDGLGCCEKVAPLVLLLLLLLMLLISLMLFAAVAVAVDSCSLVVGGAVDAVGGCLCC